jgi:hypothetical protein
MRHGVCVIAALAALSAASQAQETRIRVKAGPVACVCEPVSVEVPPAGFPGTRMLYDENQRRGVWVQVSPGSREGFERLTWIEKNLAAGETREYLLQVIDPPPPPPPGGLRPVLIDRSQEGADKLDVTVAGKPFTTYCFGADFDRPFCFPLLGPQGERVTRAFPNEKGVPGETTDHPHHLSFWFAFGAVNGVDCWASGGKTVHRAFEALERGPVFGRIRSTNDWVDAQGKKLMEDTRELRVYDVGDDRRLMDFAITLRATEGDVTLGDTKEGMFALRVASTMDVKPDGSGGRIENSEGGVDEPQTWGKRADWCDYSGPVGDHRVGIAIFDDPGNFRHPTYWMVRNYGLFACNPFGVRAYTGDANQDGTHVIPQGGELTFRYRVLIHEGDATEAGVAGLYASFAEPPTVSVLGQAASGPDLMIPEGYELAFEDDFEHGAEAWQPREGNRWEIVELPGGGHGYQLMEVGKQGEIRAPGGISLIKGREVGDFVLVAKAKCLTPATVRGRDVDVFVGYQDPAHFYYVHFSNYTDPIHNAICIVNGEPRAAITAEPPTAARLTTDDFHLLKVTRKGNRIEAYIDDMATPITHAENSRLGKGLVGLGSFDDTAVFDDVRLYVPPASRR